MRKENIIKKHISIISSLKSIRSCNFYNILERKVFIEAGLHCPIHGIISLMIDLSVVECQVRTPMEIYLDGRKLFYEKN